MKKIHQGFSLIELMIVVAIIGGLAAISEYHNMNGSFPAISTMTEIGNIVGTYVTSGAVSTGGAITVTFDTGLHSDNSLSLTLNK